MTTPMMTTGAGARKPGIRVPPEFLYIERGVHILELDNAPAEAVFGTYNISLSEISSIKELTSENFRLNFD